MLACYNRLGNQEGGRCETGIIFKFFFGEMAEWFNAAVLKTVEGNTSEGSNPSLSSGRNRNLDGVKK